MQEQEYQLEQKHLNALAREQGKLEYLLDALFDRTCTALTSTKLDAEAKNELLKGSKVFINNLTNLYDNEVLRIKSYE